jgi:hypothetical protein
MMISKLSILEQRISDRIEQTKSQIHESHNKAYIDSILIEIDTLNWVLNEISSFGLEATSYDKGRSIAILIIVSAAGRIISVLKC